MSRESGSPCRVLSFAFARLGWLDNLILWLAHRRVFTGREWAIFADGVALIHVLPPDGGGDSISIRGVSGRGSDGGWGLHAPCYPPKEAVR